MSKNKKKISFGAKMNSAPTPISVTDLPSGWTVCTGQTYDIDYTMPCSLGTVEAAPTRDTVLEWYKPLSANEEKGNNPMNYATATVQAGTTETQDQRKYLSNRLDEIYYDHLRPLEAKFGLIDDDRPSTPKELKKRIADGMFIIKGLPVDGDEEEVEDGYFYGGWTNMIRWRDPAVKADHDGYAAATKELRDLRQKTLDIIKIDEPKAGLDAIKAFEAWTPTGAAN